MKRLHSDIFYNLRSLHKILSPIVTPLIEKRGIAQAAIMLDWRKIVHHFADICAPIKLSFPKRMQREGTLYLQVESGTALKIEYAQEQILKCINTYFGYQIVTRLTIHQNLGIKKTALQPLLRQKKKSLNQEPLTALNHIACNKLTDALRNFGQTLGYQNLVSDTLKADL